MTAPDPRILEFIEEHHILTLAVSKNNSPWCATCFYIYLEDEHRFVFTSDDDTRHIRDIVESGNYNVAGAIALETKMVGNIRGIQFSGIMLRLKGDALKKARKFYLRKFPIARLTKLELWGLDPGHIKMTDNRLGFGKKLIWDSGAV
jgi:uncharacterized protein